MKGSLCSNVSRPLFCQEDSCDGCMVYLEGKAAEADHLAGIWRESIDEARAKITEEQQEEKGEEV